MGITHFQYEAGSHEKHSVFSIIFHRTQMNRVLDTAFQSQAVGFAPDTRQGLVCDSGRCNLHEPAIIRALFARKSFNKETGSCLVLCNQCVDTANTAIIRMRNQTQLLLFGSCGCTASFFWRQWRSAATAAATEIGTHFVRAGNVPICRIRPAFR